MLVEPGTSLRDGGSKSVFVEHRSPGSEASSAVLIPRCVYLLQRLTLPPSQVETCDRQPAGRREHFKGSVKINQRNEDISDL